MASARLDEPIVVEKDIAEANKKLVGPKFKGDQKKVEKKISSLYCLLFTSSFAIYFFLLFLLLCSIVCLSLFSLCPMIFIHRCCCSSSIPLLEYNLYIPYVTR